MYRSIASFKRRLNPIDSYCYIGPCPSLNIILLFIPRVSMAVPGIFLRRLIAQCCMFYFDQAFDCDRTLICSPIKDNIPLILQRDQRIEYFCLVLPLGRHILCKCSKDIIRGDYNCCELFQWIGPGKTPGKFLQYAVKINR